MKWLFLILLSLNIGIFIWGLNQDAENNISNVSDTPPANQGNLQLLSEIQNSVDSTQQASTSTPSEPGILTAIQEEKEQLVPAQISDTMSDPLQIPLDQIPQVNDSTQSEQQQTTDDAAQLDDAIQADNQGSLPPSFTNRKPPEQEIEKSIYLPPLSRPSQNTTSSGIATNASISHTSSPPPTGPYRCGVLSPIDQEITGYALVDKLSRSGISAQLTRASSSNASYWVLIPPQPSRQQAESIMSSLSSNGYDDTWLVDKGELENAISLGLFSSLGNAQSYMTEVARLGLPVELKKQKKGSTAEFSIHFPTTSALKSGSSSWNQLKKDHPQLQLRETLCEAIASPRMMQ